MNDLNALFNAKSIAIVGVSSDKTKLGSVIFSNLKSNGFKGEIFLVNPKYKSLFEFPCYPTVDSIQSDVEIVCIVVPRDYVKDVVISSVKKRAKFVVIISAGFGERDEAGKQLESEILKIAREGGINILGPNCLGYIASNSNINLSFAKTHTIPGDIAFMSQSGAFCTAVLDVSVSENLGYSHFVSIGNKVDINENALLEYFISNDSVKVISAYLEQISDDINLLKTYESSTNPKPFIILKPGKSNEAKTAMRSHTGAIADSNDVYETGMKQHGIITVYSMKSLLNLIKGFSWGSFPYGNRVTIITNAGGPAVMATDKIIESGLFLSKLDTNPIDILGDANASKYKEALDQTLISKEVDSILVLLTPQHVTEIEETAKVIIEAIKTSQKPILPIFLGKHSMNEAFAMFNSEKIPVYTEIDDAVEVISKMYFFNLWRYNKAKIGNPYIMLTSVNPGKYRSEIGKITTPEEIPVPDDLIESMLNEVGIEMPKQKFCKTIDEACEFSKDIYPVVLKAPNSVVFHKTEANGVILNINTETDLREKYKVLMQNVNNNLPFFIVQKQLKPSEEIFMGAKRDGDSYVYGKGGGFGHLLCYGKGGIYTEVYKDHAFSLVPSSDSDLVNMILKPNVTKIMYGIRGKKRLYVEGIFRALQGLQKLVLMYSAIESIDINPLFVYEDKLIAVDARIYVKS